MIEYKNLTVDYERLQKYIKRLCELNADNYDVLIFLQNVSSYAHEEVSHKETYMKMDFVESIEVLKTEKVNVELQILKGEGNENSQNFLNALEFAIRCMELLKGK